jgi:hypothetical protein
MGISPTLPFLNERVYYLFSDPKSYVRFVWRKWIEKNVAPFWSKT